MLESDVQIANLIKTGFAHEFYNRVTVESVKKGTQPKAVLITEETDDSILLKMTVGDIANCISIPLPRMLDGVCVIKHNEVTRSVQKFYRVDSEINLDYLTMVQIILFGGQGSLQGILPDNLIKKNTAIEQLTYAIEQGRVGLAVHHIQRCINSVINRFPLYTTPMNAWAMNKRICLIDPEFEAITDPKEVNKYQVEKAKKFFDMGLTPLGQADGAMASQNYILNTDLRNFSPFAIKHHNPQRNLYSTLGMRGDERPLVRTKSMQELIEKGITRTGWNLFTVFLDTPDVWEDQILVDEAHLDKFASYTKRYQCYGNLNVAVGDRLKLGQVLSTINQEDTVKFDTVCDFAVVKEINASVANVGGVATEVNNVIVEYRRGFKDGTKITNLAANKGAIRIKKLGFAIDPRTGEPRRIDVIVSSKAVLKRKNYSQVLEAIWNNCNDERPVVFEDDAEFVPGSVENLLESKGLPTDGTWECDTYVGKFNCVCGSVFWGVTHDAEDTVWDKADALRLNGRELRQAGLKLSAIEFRALETRFGKDNPITEEILSYAQGGNDLHEKFKVIRSKISQLPVDSPVVELEKLKFVGKEHGSIVPRTSVDGTVVDEGLYPNGFILKLPVVYQIVLDEEDSVEHEGFPAIDPATAQSKNLKVHNIDSIYVPHALLRKCWKHATGKFGLSDIGTLVNNIVELGHMFLSDRDNTRIYGLLYQAISNYFATVARSLGSKRGDISVYGMAVRYPHSAKAVATLSNSLPKNTVEIHTTMAETLGVVDGDVVLVERFPCLGFMSIRPQTIKITNDPMCRYTIRVSGNSLGSLSLDFDGDVIYLASFHTAAAKKALKLERSNPNKTCYSAIQKLNEKMGRPTTKTLNFQEYSMISFDPLTNETHADIVDKLASVKNSTGPVIAMSYNIMRIVENSDIKSNQKTNVAVELFLDKVANSIFKQKHGAKALHDIVVDAICTGDVAALVEEGFAHNTSKIICDVIRGKAKQIGVDDLVKYHEMAKEKGFGNIIGRIVRQQNKVYFASRSQLEGIALLKHLESPAVDVPSKLLARNLKGDHLFQRTTLDEQADERRLNALTSKPVAKEASRSLFRYLDKLLWGCRSESVKHASDNKYNLPKRTEHCIIPDTYYNHIKGVDYGRQQEVLGNINM